jgi:hypothetical protein
LLKSFALLNFGGASLQLQRIVLGPADSSGNREGARFEGTARDRCS